MRPFCLLAILAVLLPLAAAASRGGLAGGWSPIQDVNDSHVKEIAEFAVSEYNKNSGKKLQLQRVVKGETQVVAGQNFRLVLAVKVKSAAAKYVGVVYERAWENVRKLVSFDQVKN